MRSPTRIQYRIVIYNEMGHNPRDPAKKKSVSMEEKRLPKRVNITGNQYPLI